jgi:hypothetical protein
MLASMPAARDDFATRGYFRVDGFADAWIGAAMLKRVVEIIRRSDGGDEAEHDGGGQRR